MRISKISFPGLGIGEFTINAEAVSFELFGFPIRIMWYGIIICIGIFAAFGYLCYRAKKAGVCFDDVLDIMLVTVVTAVIGARLYFVVFFGGYLETDGTFWQNVKDTLYNVVAIWNGGLAIYGGILFGALAVFLMSRKKKIGFFKLADMAVPGVMLGQIIGRWGNFCNGEAFGSQTTLPWRMGLSNMETGYETLFVHPTFLYESLWNLIGFILINIFYKKRKFHGEITLSYFAWYGLGRAFIEMLRTDSLMLGPIRVSSMLSFVFFALSLTGIVLFRAKYKKALASGCVESGEIVTIASLYRGKEVASDVGSETIETEQTSSEEEENGSDAETPISEDLPTEVQEDDKHGEDH